MPSDPACISCGYSLAGLSRETLCPECAFPVARSLDATPMLRTAEPRWLRGIAFGLRLLERAMWSCTAAFVMAILAMFMAVIATTVSNLPTAVVAIVVAPMFIALIAAIVFSIGGLWLITVPVPSFHSPPTHARMAVRWLGIPAFALAALAAAIGGRWLGPFMSEAVTLAMRAVIQVAGLVSLGSLSILLAHFERSTAQPRGDLPRRLKDTRKNLYAVAVLFIIGWCQMYFGGAPASVGSAPLLIGLGFIAFDGSIGRTRRLVDDEIARAPDGNAPAVTP